MILPIPIFFNSSNSDTVYKYPEGVLMFAGGTLTALMISLVLLLISMVLIVIFDFNKVADAMFKLGIVLTIISTIALLISFALLILTGVKVE